MLPFLSVSAQRGMPTHPPPTSAAVCGVMFCSREGPGAASAARAFGAHLGTEYVALWLPPGRQLKLDVVGVT
jgi:hypothetical protein